MIALLLLTAGTFALPTHVTAWFGWSIALCILCPPVGIAILLLVLFGYLV